MSIVLGPNQYGKAENRVVRIYRDTERHEIRDINVSTSLRGDFSGAHLSGDQTRVLPTDTQKQTCYAYAKEKGIGQIEDYALALGRHFVNDVEPVEGCRIEVDEYSWDRVSVNGQEHNHTWVRNNTEVRTTILTIDGKGEQGNEYLVSGLKGLILLKSTGSEFHDFLVDKYTTLIPTNDRIMSTSLVARWRYIGTDDRLGGELRQHPPAPAGAVRGGAEPGSATDPVRDGPSRAGEPQRGGGDQVLGAEHPPLRLQPGAVRAGESQ